jgi:hypothetical protein
MQVCNDEFRLRVRYSEWVHGTRRWESDHTGGLLFVRNTLRLQAGRGVRRVGALLVRVSVVHAVGNTQLRQGEEGGEDELGRG